LPAVGGVILHGLAGQASKRKETDLVWRVPIQQIRDSGYNLDVKNPHTVDAAHRDPAELLAEYQQAQAAVNETREKLKRELQAALAEKSPPR
jgi:type I restriction enzyme M protein